MTTTNTSPETDDRRFEVVLARKERTERLTFRHYGEADKVARALRDTEAFLAVSLFDRRDNTANEYPAVARR